MSKKTEDKCPHCGKTREKDFYHNVDQAVHAPRDETPVWVCRKCQKWDWVNISNDIP